MKFNMKRFVACANVLFCIRMSQLNNSPNVIHIDDFIAQSGGKNQGFQGVFDIEMRFEFKCTCIYSCSKNFLEIYICELCR